MMKTLCYLIVILQLVSIQGFTQNDTSSSSQQNSVKSKTKSNQSNEKLAQINQVEIQLNLIDQLFTTNANNETVLKDNLFKEIKSDIDLIGARVLVKKEGKKYRFLGNEDDIIKGLNNGTFKENGCDNCTTRTCENGTVYQCGCYKGWCLCPLCADIVKLKEVVED